MNDSQAANNNEITRGSYLPTALDRVFPPPFAILKENQGSRGNSRPPTQRDSRSKFYMIDKDRGQDLSETGTRGHLSLLTGNRASGAAPGGNGDIVTRGNDPPSKSERPL